ncbi:C13 family peptidase [Sphingomonas sp.]|uniref:C13 family peptidase n=1 Tax=Sphingomonas sp. TaxID=28214 RepID=UPI001B0D4FA2|nr:C13 family peptidase [Sphingomonas sp.]MBO9714007.1 peptidase C13 [Sphingomonas sp.]
MRVRFAVASLGLVLSLAAPAVAQAQDVPRHSSGWPGLVNGDNQTEVAKGFAAGPELQRGRAAKTMLAEHRRLDRALATLQPQRKGVVDAYVVSVALDSDPVFAREAREAGKVLTRRYAAEGRSITLSGPDGRGPNELAVGSLTSLTLVLARIAELMDPKEDVLVLYTTSHGAPVGIAYHDGDEGFGLLSPDRLEALLDELGIQRRVLLLSACFSGVFIPSLASADTALLTAASSDRTSFGCRAENDWTFFGDALVNHALRKPQPLAAAGDEADTMIGGWETAAKLKPSNPQVSIGDNVKSWLGPLEAHLPPATAPVGAPATDALKGD